MIWKFSRLFVLRTIEQDLTRAYNNLSYSQKNKASGNRFSGIYIPEYENDIYFLKKKIDAIRLATARGQYIIALRITFDQYKNLDHSGTHQVEFNADKSIYRRN